MENGSSRNRKALKFAGIGFGLAAVLLVTCAMTYSYMESPEFCGGCHAMTEHTMTWQVSNHRGIECIECHLPNDGFVSHFTAKVKSGVVDAYYQTIGNVPLDIEITAEGKEYLLDNCLRCHEATVEGTSMITEGKDCTTCHRDLVHNK